MPQVDFAVRNARVLTRYVLRQTRGAEPAPAGCRSRSASSPTPCGSSARSTTSLPRHTSCARSRSAPPATRGSTTREPSRADADRRPGALGRGRPRARRRAARRRPEAPRVGTGRPRSCCRLGVERGEAHRLGAQRGLVVRRERRERVERDRRPRGATCRPPRRRRGTSPTDCGIFVLKICGRCASGRIARAARVDEQRRVPRRQEAHRRRACRGPGSGAPGGRAAPCRPRPRSGAARALERGVDVPAARPAQFAISACAAGPKPGQVAAHERGRAPLGRLRRADPVLGERRRGPRAGAPTCPTAGRAPGRPTARCRATASLPTSASISRARSGRPPARARSRARRGGHRRARRSLASPAATTARRASRTASASGQ